MEAPRMSSITIDRRIGFDGDGREVEYFVVKTKRFIREVDSKDQLLDYLGYFYNDNLESCLKVGKLISKCSEVA